MSKFGQLCRNLVGKYFMSKFDRQIFYVELRPVNNFHWTMTVDRSYTQLNDSHAAAAAAGSTGSHLGCNGTCSAISRDTSMSTQVVVLSPATPTEKAAEDEEGKGRE